MTTSLELAATMWPANRHSDNPSWVYVVGPLGSGKSTILRMLAAEAVVNRPVVVLQLQSDNSRGYAAFGASEFFDESAFMAHVERIDSAVRPLLVIDGLGPASAERLSKWISGLPAASSFDIICATPREDVTMSSAWGAALITIRVDDRSIPGVATGTIQRHSETLPTCWKMPLVTQSQIRQ